jgi:hypothetical protein
MAVVLGAINILNRKVPAGYMLSSRGAANHQLNLR